MKKFNRDERGVLVIEFMIMLSTLMLCFLGMFVFFDAFQKWMKFSTASYTVSDLLSRQTIVDDNFILSLDGVFDTISDSRSREETWLRVTSLKKVSGNISILWTVETSDFPQLDPLAADIEDLVPNMGVDEHLLLIQTYSPYSPGFSWVGLSGITLRESIATSSRFSSKLVNSDHLDFDGATDDGIDDPLAL